MATADNATAIIEITSTIVAIINRFWTASLRSEVSLCNTATLAPSSDSDLLISLIVAVVLLSRF
ncbi:MAG: hypothetical protein L2C94_004940 [Aigarchaeota archaeon]|nr:hypothetical protein [Candidatus Wolframiiraptor gerlachensis]